MRVSFAVLSLVCFGWVAAEAQSAQFTVNQHDHQVGTARFQITPTADGFDSISTVRVSMQGLDYALSKTEQLDTAHHIQNVMVSGTVNGSAVSVTGKPDGEQFLLNMSANGRTTTNRLAAHPGEVFLPDFDPGALETLVALAAAQNDRDVWAIIPKESGSVQAVQPATLPDEQGTLNGKQITVHHLEATIAGAPTELFFEDNNELVQAEFSQEGFALVRDGFVLTPPKKPIAPPSGD